MLRTTSVTFSTLPSISIALMTSFAVHGSRTGLCDGKVGEGGLWTAGTCVILAQAWGLWGSC